MDSQSPALYNNCFELPSDWLLSYWEPIRGQLKTITIYSRALGNKGFVHFKLCYLYQFNSRIVALLEMHQNCPEPKSHFHKQIRNWNWWQKIEDPQKLANEFSNFFVEKVQKLDAGINTTNIDHLSLLKEKMKTSNITFTIKTVNVSVVHKVLKDLKTKSHDGITSEILKIGKWLV